MTNYKVGTGSTTIMNKQFQQESKNGINARRLLLWLVIVSIVMIFGALTSAFIVRKADGAWFDYTIPELFTYSTGIILLSSLTMHLAVRSIKNDSVSNYRTFIWLTLGLGFAFLVAQVIGWKELPFGFGGDSSTTSVSFFYVLSGMHWAHIILGLAYIVYAIVTIRVSNERKDKNVIRIGNCAIFWHFLDGLWLYLYVFLLIKH